MCARALPGAYDAADGYGCRDFDSIGKLVIGRQLGQRRPRRRAGAVLVDGATTLPPGFVAAPAGMAPVSNAAASVP